MSDLVTVGDASLRLSPVGSERLETATDVRMRTAGTECAVAVAASRLGADSVWMSQLPDTALGRRVVSELHEHGITTDVNWVESGRQGLLFHESASEPRESMTIPDRVETAAASMTPGDLTMDRVQNARMVFVAGSTLALSDTAMQTAQAVMRAGGGGETGLAVFDLDYQPSMWPPEAAKPKVTTLLDATDVLFANEDQLRTVLDRSGQPRELAHTLAAERDIDMVVITRSEHGAIAYHDGVIHEQDSIETDVVDPAGQHEAFIGGYLQRLAEGAPPDEALSYGVGTAALARTIPGPLTTVNREEVEALLD